MNRLAAILLLLCTITAAPAQNATNRVTLEWRPNTETNLSGYVVYSGTASRAYGTSNVLGIVTNTTVLGLSNDTLYFFALTAFDFDGIESDYSNEVMWRAGPQNAITGLATRRLPGVTNSLILSWQSSDEQGVSAYRVNVGTNAGARAWSYVEQQNYSVITGLVPGTAYFFSVAPLNDAGIEGPNSSELARIFRWPAVPGSVQLKR
jgi:hypothetical protein